LRAVLPGGFFTRIHSMNVVAADNAYLRSTPLAYNVSYHAVRSHAKMYTMIAEEPYHVKIY